MNLLDKKPDASLNRYNLGRRFSSERGFGQEHEKELKVQAQKALNPAGEG